MWTVGRFVASWVSRCNSQTANFRLVREIRKNERTNDFIFEVMTAAAWDFYSIWGDSGNRVAGSGRASLFHDRILLWVSVMPMVLVF